MEKKTLIIALIISLLLFSSAFGAKLVNFGRANPYSQAMYKGVGVPPYGTEPPEVSILSPLNYVKYNTNNISLTFVARVGEAGNASRMHIFSVHYRAAWLQNDIEVNSFELYRSLSEFQHTINLTGIPEGNHSVEVRAIETGTYYADLFSYYSFIMPGSSSVSFTINTSNNATVLSDENGTADGAPPDGMTKPPVITILTPTNNTFHRTKDIALTLKVSAGDSTVTSAQLTSEIYYKADWEQSGIWIYKYHPGPYLQLISDYSATIDLTGIPDGMHTITVNATERRQYDGYNDYSKGLHYKIFEITGSSSVSFTVDTKAPSIFVLSPQNKTYASSDVQLNFVAFESGLQITYSLDEQQSVTVLGNTTLTDLSIGHHNLTIYAKDEAGNIGALKTVVFTTAEPFPTTMIMAPIASVAFVGAGLMVYLKRKR
jgi:hypothetical protein